MTQAEIVKKVAQANEMSQAKTTAVINTIMITITDALVRGEKVNFPGFGIFNTIERAAKTVTPGFLGPDTKPVHVPARKAITFQPSKTLKDHINRS